MCVPPEATLEKPCLRRGKEQLLLRTEAHPHKENRRQAAGCWSECTPSGRQLVHAHLIFHLRPSCIIYPGLPQCGTAPKQRPSWIADTLVFLPQLFKIYWGSKKKKKKKNSLGSKLMQSLTEGNTTQSVQIFWDWKHEGHGAFFNFKLLHISALAFPAPPNSTQNPLLLFLHQFFRK